MKRYILSLCFVEVLLIMSCVDEDVNTPPPTIYFASDAKYEIVMGDTLFLQPRITYDQGSRYEWFVNNLLVGDELNYTFTPKEMTDYNFQFVVTNSYGSDTAEIYVCVRDGIDFSSFDNSKAPSSVRSLKTFPDRLDYFSIRDHLFSNTLNADSTMWGGFAWSCRTSIQTMLTNEAFGCAYITSQEANNNQYVAVSGYSEPIVLFNDEYVVKSIDVANDNFAFLISKFGYSDSTLVIAPFTQNDYLLLRIYGIDKNGELTPSFVEHSLVDCAYDNPAKYFRQTEWVTLSLKQLGRVAGLYFEITSNNEDFPPFCCVDNIKLQSR